MKTKKPLTTRAAVFVGKHKCLNKLIEVLIARQEMHKTKLATDCLHMNLKGTVAIIEEYDTLIELLKEEKKVQTKKKV